MKLAAGVGKWMDRRLEEWGAAGGLCWWVVSVGLCRKKGGGGWWWRLVVMDRVDACTWWEMSVRLVDAVGGSCRRALSVDDAGSEYGRCWREGLVHGVGMWRKGVLL